LVFVVGDVDGVLNNSSENPGGHQKEGAIVGNDTCKMKCSLNWDDHVEYEVNTDTNSDPLVHEDMVVKVRNEERFKEVWVSLAFGIELTFSVQIKSVVNVLACVPNENQTTQEEYDKVFGKIHGLRAEVISKSQV
jgi:hypothetical protein